MPKLVSAVVVTDVCSSLSSNPPFLFLDAFCRLSIQDGVFSVVIYPSPYGPDCIAIKNIYPFKKKS